MVKRLQKPKTSQCVPNESYGQSDDLNRPGDDEYSSNCVPKPGNIDKRYQRDVNTSDLYRTSNIPARFERSCELKTTNI